MNKVICLFLFIAIFLTYGFFCDVAHGSTELRGEIYYGHASWYGRKFQGRKTSSGEPFDRKQLTAAHNSFPFNTKVKVTNLKNNKSVIVRINDRGPFKGDRIIDLSEEAAEIIGAKEVGIVYVRLQVVDNVLGDKVADKKLDNMQNWS